jgi:hypothetical protein
MEVHSWENLLHIVKKYFFALFSSTPCVTKGYSLSRSASRVEGEFNSGTSSMVRAANGRLKERRQTTCGASGLLRTILVVTYWRCGTFHYG